MPNILERWQNYNIKKDLKLEVIDFEEDHQAHYWHGGPVASFFYKGYNISIEAVGDVVVDLLDENNDLIVETKDKNNAGAFYDNMGGYIKNDSELTTLIKEYYEDRHKSQKKILIYNNNWWEVFAEKDGVFYDMMWVLDSMFIKEAIHEAIDLKEEIVKHLDSMHIRK